MEEKFEDLFLRSLDDPHGEVPAPADARAQRTQEQYLRVRSLLARPEADSFGPFFAERIINRIKSMKKEIDYQIFFFFKKYQLAALGVVVALLALNIVFSDQLTLKSVLGFDDVQSDSLVTIDLYQDLTE